MFKFVCNSDTKYKPTIKKTIQLYHKCKCHDHRGLGFYSSSLQTKKKCCVIVKSYFSFLLSDCIFRTAVIHCTKIVNFMTPM